MLVINLKTEQRAHNYSLLSDRLLQEIKSTLQKSGKIVLFHNRKGYAKRIICRDCKYIIECEECGRPLILQLPLSCTYCASPKSLTPCPKCKGIHWKFLGYGLQRIKQELEKQTNVSVAIITEEQNLLTKYDILLTTQIPFLTPPNLHPPVSPLRKGGRGENLSNHFSLASLLNADTSLYLPDFTSAVNTFNRITAFKKFCREMGIAQAVVQTYAPRHYAIYHGVRSQFQAFIKRELQERKRLNYPPYSQLIKLIYQHKDQNVCKNETQKMYDTIRKLKIENSEISVSPPQPAFIHKVRGNWRWEMVIKVKNYEYKKINFFLKTLPPTWLIDVDPVSLL